MKIRRISEFQRRIPFPNFDSDYGAIRAGFLDTDLGKLDQAIPWQALVSECGLQDKVKGPRSLFSPKGKLALMFLKHYAGCSDSKLIEQLNGNVYYQLFCDVVIDLSRPLKNYKIVSQIRCELASKLDIAALQMVLAKSWKEYIEAKDSMCCDATCYESYIRYPTDIKLLYEAVSWNYGWLKRLSKQVKQKMPRTKMSKWRKRYGTYSRSKRPSRKVKRALRRGLLLLLNKINEALKPIERQMASRLSSDYWRRRAASIKIYEQQHKYFHHGIKPAHRIVSLDKDYIRPIVRGKEVKKVEFGAKVHKLMVGPVSFIEHISFDAFNEGSRLKSSIWLTQKLMGKRIKVVGADAIYATNKNRKYISKRGIKTDFKRKGRPSKHSNHFEQLAQRITKERASRLEGSFGTDKEHFLLNRIKARTAATEVLWIFFGIHTANGVKIGRKMALFKKHAA